MERQILHSDMNNFYASVECMLDPRLKGRPLAVCGSEEDRSGIVLARNYEAKAHGVTTADVIWQAKQKCPDLVIVPPNYEQYMKYSSKAKEIYNRYSHQVESFGMDECWIDVTGSQQGTGYEIAEKIRQTIKVELRLTVSIGVSFNKIFAKLGSDMKKPDAITEIKRESFREQIWVLPVEDLIGVGRATQTKLARFCIKTIGDLARADDYLLKHLCGINGLKLKTFANGLDNSPVQDICHSIPMKTIGHGVTATQDLETSYEVWCLMLWLSQSIGSKLMLYGKKASGVAISVRTSQLTSQQWQLKLDYSTQSPRYIADECFNLFSSHYKWIDTIRAITVRAIYLQDESVPEQLNLFTDFSVVRKRESIDKTIEHIRLRFGEKSIYSACLHQHEKIPSHSAVEITMPTGYF